MTAAYLFRAAMVATSILAAACGGSATSPSGVVLASVTVIGPSGAGGLILHRNESATGTVTLSAVAPANGATVTLETIGAERTALILPSTVTIARGSTSATFPVMVTSSGVSRPAEVTLRASYGGGTQSVLIRLAP